MPTHLKFAAFAAAAAFVLLLYPCDTAPASAKENAKPAPNVKTLAATPKTGAKPDPSTDPAGIHNLMKLSGRFYSGSEPHGDEGFASLAKLGVKTVVSVDGAKPNLEAARKHGIRYVHIPIGYDGVPEDAGLSLARVAKDAEGPIYVHCHHGKHRGPAAAAVACIAAGDSTNKDAIGILERAGTSKDYKGLWRDVQNFVPPPDGAALPELVEVAEVGSFPAAMSQVDRAFDNLKLCRDAKWSVPPDHPDIVPEQEALLLFEGLFEAGRNQDDAPDPQFKKWLAESESAANNLRSDLRKKDLKAATDRLLLLEKSCKQCHQKYRDN
jgi:protein tyrosine phosphatase (PTP) superfamily phosphohydrolase (DUF442 family)